MVRRAGLAQHQAVLGRPGANHTQRRPALGPVVAPTESFAVNGHHFALDQFAYLSHPGSETRAELSGFKRPKTRPNVSWEGMPLGSFRNLANQSLLALPNSSISTQLSAPQITAPRVMTMMSSSSCRYVARPGPLSGPPGLRSVRQSVQLQFLRPYHTSPPV